MIKFQLPNCLYFSRFWAISVLPLFVSQAVTSWILKLTFFSLIKLFFYVTKKSRQKFRYHENEKRFYGEIKAFFIVFKGLSVAKIYLRPVSAPLTLKQIFLESGNLLQKTELPFCSWKQLDWKLTISTPNCHIRSRC